MRKTILIALLPFIYCTVTYGQKVVHHSYTTYYNVAMGEADSVSWTLTPNMVSCDDTTDRVDQFAMDPSISNSTLPNAYKNSGYDKGHLFPYADAECNDKDRIECFYMSNMLPQLHGLNAGDWKTLETQERVWAAAGKIRIIAGGFGTKGKLASGVNIPESCWKAIYVNGKWHAWVMPNSAKSKGHSYTYWEVRDIKRFNKIVNLHL